MATLGRSVGPFAAARRQADPMAVARVHLCYLWRHGRLPDLANAPRFTEQVQLRKLLDRDPRQTPLMDKIAAKAAAARTIGPEWTIPTLWSGDALPPRDGLHYPAILKARHGCNQNAVLRQRPSQQAWSALGRRAASWTAAPYGGWLDEWAYRDVPRGLLAEPLVGHGAALPLDYKIYVFGGRATHVQVHLDRAGAHRWVLHDRDFRPLVPTGEGIARPRSLEAMLSAAEALAAGWDFLRVDFYEVGGAPLFGEFCLYPGSGLDPFAADWIDFELGALWRDARTGFMPKPAYTAPLPSASVLPI